MARAVRVRNVADFHNAWLRSSRRLAGVANFAQLAARGELRDWSSHLDAMRCHCNHLAGNLAFSTGQRRDGTRHLPHDYGWLAFWCATVAGCWDRPDDIDVVAEGWHQ